MPAAQWCSTIFFWACQRWLLTWKTSDKVGCTHFVRFSSILVTLDWTCFSYMGRLLLTLRRFTQPLGSFDTICNLCSPTKSEHNRPLPNFDGCFSASYWKSNEFFWDMTLLPIQSNLIIIFFPVGTGVIILWRLWSTVFFWASLVWIGLDWLKQGRLSGSCLHWAVWGCGGWLTSSFWCLAPSYLKTPATGTLTSSPVSTTVTKRGR